MSIAASVIVRASPTLRAMSAAMCAGAVLIGFLIVSGYIGDMPLIARAVLAAACIFLGFFGFYHGARHRKHQHIDISGAGQIRLVERGDTGPCGAADRPHLNKYGQVVHLLPSSTLWHWLLLLRLRTGCGRIITVPVMPDSVSQENFRALSVACRWMLSRIDSNDKR